MLIFFRSRHEAVSRSYDFTSTGFMPLPTRKQTPTDTKFHWSLNLIRDIGAVYSSIFIAAVGYGIMMVLIAFKLEANVKHEVLMSASATTQIGAGIFFAKFLPILGRKIGLVNTVYAAMITIGLCSLLIYQYYGYALWILTIFILGIALFTCGVTRATIMIDLAPKHVRSMVISLGTMLVAVGNAIGAIVLSLIGSEETFTSFAVAAGFCFLSMVPLARLKNIDSNMREEKKISIWRYIKNSPKIMLAGFSVSYAMASASAFLIIYGIKVGMEQSQAALLLSILLFGTILYIPIGYISDLLNRRMLMILSALLSLVCVTLLNFNNNEHEIYLLLFLMFGCLSGMKLPAIVLINEKYKPTQRLAVNSAFSRVGLIGNICGLAATGITMRVIGPHGLWISLMVILSIFLIFCFFHYSRKMINGKMKIKDFSIFNKHQSEEIKEA